MAGTSVNQWLGWHTSRQSGGDESDSSGWVRVPSDLGQPAIHLDVGSVDIARLVGCEKRDDIGDFRGLRVPPYRNQTTQLVIEALEIGALACQPIKARGYGRTGAYRVHANPPTL
jgi:hypothetical protein